jgi:hypothetical protein
LAGCAGISNGTKNTAPLTDNTAPNFEGQRIWGRPLETVIELGQDIRGEADSTSVLFGLIATGPDTVDGLSGSLLMFASNLFSGGSNQASDPLVSSAAGNAALNANADGIYVTHVDVDGANYLGIYGKRHAVVVGKAIKLKVVGEVSEERSDRDRLLRAIGGGAVLLPPGAVRGLGVLGLEPVAPPPPAKGR